MSAWVCSKLHVACLVKYATTDARRVYLPSELRTVEPEAIAGMLYAENVRSVNHRYPNHPPDEPLGFSWFRDILPAPDLTAVQAIKAAHCLEYQSCEHPEWHDSLARKVLRSICDTATGEIPGYDAAPWGIDAAADLTPEVQP